VAERVTAMVRVVISAQAIARSHADNRIQQQLTRYFKEIRLIAGNARTPGVRGAQVERIGDFFVSPQVETGEGIRVAWHLARLKDDIVFFIDDLLYHVSEKYYVDKWNERARQGKIMLRYYGGYQDYKDELLAA